MCLRRLRCVPGTALWGPTWRRDRRHDPAARRLARQKLTVPLPWTLPICASGFALLLKLHFPLLGPLVKREARKPNDSVILIVPLMFA
jgi:hypothetical protein